MMEKSALKKTMVKTIPMKSDIAAPIIIFIKSHCAILTILK